MTFRGLAQPENDYFIHPFLVPSIWLHIDCLSLPPRRAGGAVRRGVEGCVWWRLGLPEDVVELNNANCTSDLSQYVSAPPNELQ